MQIRLRLTIQFILIAAGILVAAFFYIHFQFKRNLQDEYYDNLRSKARIIAEMVVGTKTGERDLQIPEPRETFTPLANEYPENISIFSLDGRRLYTFNPSPDNIQQSNIRDVTSQGECKFTHGEFNAIGILYKNQAGDQFVVVAESMFDKVHIQNLSRILMLVFLISITLVAAGGWFFCKTGTFTCQRNHEPGRRLIAY